MAKEKPSKEEIEKKRADTREAALKSFKGAYTDLAAAYFIQDNKGYGDNVNSAVDQFVYSPAVKTDEYVNLLRESRQGGKRYTGSEYGVIEAASNIIKESLAALKVEDVIQLLGSKINVRDAYKGKYLSDIAESGEEGKKFVGEVTGTYLAHLTDSKSAEALIRQDKARIGRLEEKLKEEKKS